MFKNMKISMQLGLGFGSMLCLAATIAASSVWALGSLMGGLRTVTDDVWPKTSIANQNIQAAYDYARAFSFIVVFEGKENVDPVALGRSHDVLRDTVLFVNEKVDVLEKMLTTGQEKDLLDIVRKRRAAYSASRQKVLALKEAGASEKASYLLLTETNDLQTEYIQSWKDFINFENASLVKGREAADNIYHLERALMLGIFAIGLIAGLFIAIGIVRNLHGSLGGEPGYAAWIVRKIAAGDLSTDVIARESDQSSLLAAMKGMMASLRVSRETERARDWLKSGLNELNGVMRGEHETREMAEKVLNYLAERVGAGVGALYLYAADSEELTPAAGYAMARGAQALVRIALGQGLVGQAARDRKTLVLSEVPDGYLPIGSGVGQAAPRNIIAIPLMYADSLAGVIELGSFHPFTALEMDFLEHVKEGVAIGFGVNQSRHRLQTLLTQTEQQTEELRVQQEELQQSNEELEERAEMLEAQREQIRTKNQEVEAASQEIQRKVAELERVSSYKSEFLSNMSHELRTPLNSMLILSSLLQKNKEGLLTPKQVEYAATIHGAGKDLLNLINDILDLSKIEAGHLEFHFEDVAVKDMVNDLTGLFKPIADDRHLEFQVTLEEGVPPVLRADAQRLQQIVRNLLSNAFKFTARGQVALHIGVPAGARNPLSVQALAFVVSDSGIGIPADKQEQIFLAFQQADGSTSRKYGGTGLGLSISRQLAQRMGGEITLDSEPGRGSIFTLYLPLDAAQEAARTMPPAELIPAPIAAPSHPVSSTRLLVVEDDEMQATSIAELLDMGGLEIVIARTGSEALQRLQQEKFDCMVLDLGLTDMSGYDVLDQLSRMNGGRNIPVIVHSGRSLSEADERRLKDYTDNIIVKGAQSPERLLNEVSLFLHLVKSSLPQDKRKMIRRALDKEALLEQRKVLVVDDDIRNIFSLSSVLGDKGMHIVEAGNGREALAALDEHPDIDIVLMDIMMPEMDGYEAMRRIRANPHHTELPIIALTAKAMVGDQQLCLDAGANDYITKPVDIDKLFSLMRVWLYQAGKSRLQ